MNIPINVPLVENVFLEQLMPDKLFLDLANKKFSGYTYLAVNGKYGFEESIIIFTKGNVVGSIFLIDSYEIELFGLDAFNFGINAFGNKDGLLNIYNLNDDQIKLILIFNDKVKFDYKVDNGSLSKLNIKYNEILLDKLLSNKIEIKESKTDIFNKLNLSELLND
ncbi:MAG: hypothetical protein WCF78_04170 [archaeon]